jgi:hypothetical protein
MLLGRLAVEVLFVHLCVCFRSVHYGIAMVRRSIERVKLHQTQVAVDDVVVSAGWHQDREPGLDAMLNAVKHRLAFAFLYSEELIELVDLCTDILTGLKAHHNELAIFRRVQDRAERLVLLRCLFDVVDVAFHSFLNEIPKSLNRTQRITNLRRKFQQ